MRVNGERLAMPSEDESKRNMVEAIYTLIDTLKGIDFLLRP